MYYRCSPKCFCFLSLLSSPTANMLELAGITLNLCFSPPLQKSSKRCWGLWWDRTQCLHWSTPTALADICSIQTPNTSLTTALMKYTLHSKCTTACFSLVGYNRLCNCHFGRSSNFMSATMTGLLAVEKLNITELCWFMSEWQSSELSKLAL